MGPIVLVMKLNPQAVATQRKLLGLTQAQLAERIGVAENSVGNIETGRVVLPRPGVLKALADALGVEIRDLVTLDDPESSDAEAVA